MTGHRTAIVLAFALLAAACSGGGDATTTTTRGVAPASTTSSPPNTEPPAATTTTLPVTTTTISEVPVPPELEDSAIATSYGVAGPTVALGADGADGSGCTPGAAPLPVGQWDTLPDGVWHVNIMAVTFDSVIVDLACRYSDPETIQAAGRHFRTNEAPLLRRVFFNAEGTLFWEPRFSSPPVTSTTVADLRASFLDGIPVYEPRQWGWLLVENGAMSEFLASPGEVEAVTDGADESELTEAPRVNPVIQAREDAGVVWESGDESDGSGCEPDTTRTLPDGLWYVDVLALRGESATVQLGCYYGDNPAKRLELGDPECGRDENGEAYCEFDNYAWEYADQPAVTMPIAGESIWVFTWSPIGFGLRAQLTPADADLGTIFNDHRDTWLTHGFALVEAGVIVAWISNTVQFA